MPLITVNPAFAIFAPNIFALVSPSFVQSLEPIIAIPFSFKISLLPKIYNFLGGFFICLNLLG